MNDDILEVFREFVEEYTPEEPEKSKEERIPEPEISEEEEAARRAKEDSEREKQMWIQSAKEKRDAAFKMIKTKSERVLRKRTDLIDYLTVQARFDRYTVNNCLLIAAQLPGAIKLKSFDDWKAEDRNIKRGAKAITILEPGDEYIRADGSVGRHYNTRALFDISQVTGGRLEPEPSSEKMKDKLVTLFKTIQLLDRKLCSYGEDGGRAAFFQAGKKAVYVNKSADLDVLYPQLCVELAHVIIANNHKDYTRKAYGSICEMVGYIMCVRNNVSVTEDAIPLRLAPGYESLQKNQVTKILDEVRCTANTMSRTIRTIKAQEVKERQKSEIHPQTKEM